MRAATVIVGAVAAASILIALAFIFSGGGSSGAVTTTKTVVVVEPASSSAEGGIGGPTECGGDEFSVENVSCEIGEQIHHQYEEGSRGDLFAQSSAETITMTCKEAAPVECTGPGGAKVYFGG
jgi:hypothetical protein